MEVSLIDLKRQYAPLRKQMLSTFERLLDSGNFILGNEVAQFEKEVADYLGSRFAIGVTSGTDALWLSLKALGIDSGDRVLTTPFTFFATISSIVNVGAEPVFADIEAGTFNLDAHAVEQVLVEDREKRIKAIVPVHLYGQAAEMDKLLSLGQRFGVPIIEDAAQAIGTEYGGKKVGTLGAFGNFSFYPTKNLGAMGDAGLLVTQDERLYERARRLRTHGEIKKYYHSEVGSNCRIDALQAALLRVSLPYLDEWIAKRQKLASYYDDALAGFGDLVVTPYRAAYSNHTFHQYTIRVKNNGRDSLQMFLRESQVASLAYYPVPCHLQEALKKRGFKSGMFPHSEHAALEVLSLPLFPDMRVEEQNYVTTKIREWCQRQTTVPS